MFPKLERPKTDVTLIAGFKCADGYVLCADSQNTVRIQGASYRMTRQKLVPVKVGIAEMAIAGSGDGILIDAFVGRLKRTLKGSQAGEMDSIQQLFKEEFTSFARDKKVRTKEIDDKLRFLIGVHSPARSECSLWRTLAGDPVEVDDYALVGFDDTRYDYAVRNFYRPHMPISQGVFLGLYVMWLAEQTSNYVKGPISVVVLKDNGIHFEGQEKIDSIDRKVRLFTSQFESQFLACSDTGIQNSEFAKNLIEFGSTLVQFRRDFISEWVGEAVDKGLDKVVDQWNSIPTGTTIVLDPQSHEHLRIQKQLVEAWRANENGKQDYGRLVVNLERVLKHRKRELLKYINPLGEPIVEHTETENVEYMKAFEELDAAWRMGAFKIGQDTVELIARVNQILTHSLGFGAPIEMQLQVIATEQAIAHIKSLMPSSSQLRLP